MKVKLPHVKLPGLQHDQKSGHDANRRKSGELLSEVAEHVKSSLVDENTLQGMPPASEQKAVTNHDLIQDDGLSKEGKLAELHQAEELERIRRINEPTEEEKLRFDEGLASTVLEEETERARRMSGDVSEMFEANNRHKEAELIKQKLSMDQACIKEEERFDESKNSRLLHTVQSEDLERRARLNEGDTQRQINGHLSAAILKEHLSATKESDTKNDVEREADRAGAMIMEQQEAERRLSQDVREHDMEHAAQEATLIKQIIPSL